MPDFVKSSYFERISTPAESLLRPEYNKTASFSEQSDFLSAIAKFDNETKSHPKQANSGQQISNDQDFFKYNDDEKPGPSKEIPSDVNSVPLTIGTRKRHLSDTYVKRKNGFLHSPPPCSKDSLSCLRKNHPNHRKF